MDHTGIVIIDNKQKRCGCIVFETGQQRRLKGDHLDSSHACLLYSLPLLCDL